jgi:prevent-host-death family protein
MSSYNVAEAKAKLSELIARAVAGEEVIVSRDHKPLVRLQPLAPDKGPRRPGSARGEVWIADDFDAPLDDFADYR